MNKIILKGNIGKEFDNNNGAVKTSLAVPRRKEGTDWFNIVAFGKTGEMMQTYLAKGNQVLIEGHVQVGSYTNREGRKVGTFDVIVDSFEFCGSKEKKEEGFMSIPEGLEDEGVPFV